MVRKDIKKQLEEFFFTYPTKKLRLRAIEREAHLTFPSVIRYTKELEKEGILTHATISQTTFYSADRSSQNYLLQKKLYNLEKIEELKEYLKNELANPVIILFGSYSKGEDTEESDIDLFIQSLSKKKLDLSLYEKKLQRPIQIFRYGSIKEVKNKDLANNILNGINLTGFIEVYS